MEQWTVKITTFWNYNWSKNCVSSSLTMISRKKVTYNIFHIYSTVLQSVRDTNYLCSRYNTRPEIFFSLLATIHLVLPSHGGNLSLVTSAFSLSPSFFPPSLVLNFEFTRWYVVSQWFSRKKTNFVVGNYWWCEDMMTSI